MINLTQFVEECCVVTERTWACARLRELAVAYRWWCAREGCWCPVNLRREIGPSFRALGFKLSQRRLAKKLSKRLPRKPISVVEGVCVKPEVADEAAAAGYKAGW